MKTLNTYIKNYLNESLLDDEDVLSGPEKDNAIIENWIKENFKIKGTLKIDKDFTVDCTGDVAVKNNNITSLTNKLFRWGKVGGYFDCYGCKNLKTLEGAPEVVKVNFSCSYCDDLENLIGSPKRVGANFLGTHCKNLKSLKGSPKWIGGDFECQWCKNLKTLKEGPEFVGGDFLCWGCDDLSITHSDRMKYKIRS